MNDRKLLKTGIVGTVVMAVCCFTPALVILLGVAGLSAWLAWADYVLWPAMIFFAGLTVYAYVRWSRARASGGAAQTSGR